jgi:hypothetical protein
MAVTLPMLDLAAGARREKKTRLLALTILRVWP